MLFWDIGYIHFVAFNGRLRGWCAFNRCHECLAHDAHELEDTGMGRKTVPFLSNSNVHFAANKELLGNFRLCLRWTLEGHPDSSSELR